MASTHATSNSESKKQQQQLSPSKKSEEKVSVKTSGGNQVMFSPQRLEPKYTEPARTSSSSFKPPMSKEALAMKQKQAQLAESQKSVSLFSYIKNVFTGGNSTHPTSTSSSLVDDRQKSAPIKVKDLHIESVKKKMSKNGTINEVVLEKKDGEVEKEAPITTDDDSMPLGPTVLNDNEVGQDHTPKHENVVTKASHRKPKFPFSYDPKALNAKPEDRLVYNHESTTQYLPPTLLPSMSCDGPAETKANSRLEKIEQFKKRHMKMQPNSTDSENYDRTVALQSGKNPKHSERHGKSEQDKVSDNNPKFVPKHASNEKSDDFEIPAMLTSYDATRPVVTKKSSTGTTSFRASSSPGINRKKTMSPKMASAKKNQQDKRYNRKPNSTEASQKSRVRSKSTPDSLFFSNRADGSNTAAKKKSKTQVPVSQKTPSQTSLTDDRDVTVKYIQVKSNNGSKSKSANFKRGKGVNSPNNPRKTTSKTRTSRSNSRENLAGSRSPRPSGSRQNVSPGRSPAASRNASLTSQKPQSDNQQQPPPKSPAVSRNSSQANQRNQSPHRLRSAQVRRKQSAKNTDQTAGITKKTNSRRKSPKNTNKSPLTYRNGRRMSPTATNNKQPSPKQPSDQTASLNPNSAARQRVMNYHKSPTSSPSVKRYPSATNQSAPRNGENESSSKILSPVLTAPDDGEGQINTAESIIGKSQSAFSLNEQEQSNAALDASPEDPMNIQLFTLESLNCEPHKLGQVTTIDNTKCHNEITTINNFNDRMRCNSPEYLSQVSSAKIVDSGYPKDINKLISESVCYETIVPENLSSGITSSQTQDDDVNEGVTLNKSNSSSSHLPCVKADSRSHEPDYNSYEIDDLEMQAADEEVNITNSSLYGSPSNATASLESTRGTTSNTPNLSSPPVLGPSIMRRDDIHDGITSPKAQLKALQTLHSLKREKSATPSDLSNSQKPVTHLQVQSPDKSMVSHSPISMMPKTAGVSSRRDFKKADNKNSPPLKSRKHRPSSPQDHSPIARSLERIKEWTKHNDDKHEHIPLRAIDQKPSHGMTSIHQTYEMGMAKREKRKKISVEKAIKSRSPANEDSPLKFRNRTNSPVSHSRSPSLSTKGATAAAAVGGAIGGASLSSIDSENKAVEATANENQPPKKEFSPSNVVRETISFFSSLSSMFKSAKDEIMDNSVLEEVVPAPKTQARVNQKKTELVNEPAPRSSFMKSLTKNRDSLPAQNTSTNNFAMKSPLSNDEDDDSFQCAQCDLSPTSRYRLDEQPGSLISDATMGGELP